MSHYTNRYNFWNENKQKIVLIDPKFSSYREFENSFFKNETNFYTFFNLMRDQFNFGQDLKTLYSIFACDFEWAKKTVFCGGSTSSGSTSSGTTNMFGCLTKRPEFKYSTQHNNVILKTPNYYWAFFSNNRFFQNTPARKGYWSCDGGDHFSIKLDNGKTYSSKTGEWTDGVASSSSNNTTITDTNLTGNDLAAGQAVKVGMKGDIVTKIQELLIAKGYVHVSKNDTADGIFGNRTKRMVMAFQAANGLNDDGVVGKLTWAKLNDGSAASNDSTNQATSVKDPYEVPGSDSSIMQESRKKILRKYLQEFK